MNVGATGGIVIGIHVDGDACAIDRADPRGVDPLAKRIDDIEASAEAVESLRAFIRFSPVRNTAK